MMPERLRLLNFGPYADETIDFTELGPAVVLTGRTGGGKSTLIDALIYIRTGECRVSLDEQIRRGQVEMRVEEEFSHGGERYRVVRGRSRKGRGASVFELYIRSNDQWVSLSGKQAKLDAILGTDYELLTATSFSLQGKSGRFLESRPSERLAATRRLLRLDAFGGYIQAARLELRTADARHEQLMSELQTAEAAVAHANHAAAALATLRVEIEALQTNEQRLTEALAATDASLAQAQQVEEKRRALQVAASEAERDASAARSAYDRTNARLEQARREGARLADARAGVEAQEEAKRAEAAAADELAAARVALEHAEHVEREHLSRASAALSRELELRMRVEADIADVKRTRTLAVERAQRALDEVRAKERVAAERRAHEASTRARDRERAKADLDRANQHIAVLGEVPCHGEGRFASCWYLADARRARGTLHLIADAFEKIPADLPEPEPWEVSPEEEAALDALASARAAIGSDVQPPAGAGEHEGARQALASLGPPKKADAERAAARVAQEHWDRARRRVTDQSGWPAVVAMAERALATGNELEAELDAARAARQRSDARRAALQEELESTSVTAFATLRRKRDEQWAELRRTRAEAAEKSGRVGQLQAQIEACATAQCEIERLQREVEVQFATINSLKLLVEIYREIPVLVLETAIPAVEHGANQMLNDLRSGFRVRLATEAKAKTTDAVRDTLDILVTDRRGYEAPYESYSGGERFMLDLALREALGELLAARAGFQDPPILVIDEGWGTLDPHYVRACADALANVIASGRFGLVLAVTHVQDLIDLFEKKLIISGGADGVARVHRSTPLAAAA